MEHYEQLEEVTPVAIITYRIWAYIPDGQTIVKIGQHRYADPKAHGWYPVLENPPVVEQWQRAIQDDYDQWTFDIDKKVVIATYSIVNRPASEMLLELYGNVKRFIETQPDGWIRYDPDLKMNILLSLIQGQKTELCASALSWIEAVQMEFFRLKNLLKSGIVEDVNVSYEHFELLFGAEGFYLPDPAISTTMLKAK
jgi:hypothetical protein